MVAPEDKESRKFGRYNVNYETEVVFASKAISATITNESIGGIRIHLNVPPHFSVGSQVIIRQDDIETDGYVRNIGSLEDGGIFAGISWSAPEDESTPGDFLNYGELTVVCRERADLPDGTSKITLWDGATFNTATGSLVSINRDARESELKEMKSKLAVLAKLYGIEPAGDRQQAIERIMEFEFPVATVPTA